MSIVKQAIEKYDGRVIPFVCTGTVTVGDVIPIGVSMVGIAVNTGLTGEKISLEIEKVWTITAKTADVIAVGDVVYWDNTAKVLTLTSSGNIYAGRAITAKAAVAGTIDVKINV